MSWLFLNTVDSTGSLVSDVSFISCLSLCNVPLLPALPSQVHDKDVIVLEPHPQHTLLASFGEDTAETEEEMDNTYMWCEL